jgi:serine/threonine protein kinase
VKYIGWEVLRRLQFMHSIGYLHRDIKTENIVVGDSNRLHQVFLIDFGLALQYIKNGKQIEPRSYTGLIGTARFASVNAHEAL